LHFFANEFLYTYFRQFDASVSQESMLDEAGRSLISLFQNQLIYSIKFYNIDILTLWLPRKAEFQQQSDSNNCKTLKLIIRMLILLVVIEKKNIFDENYFSNFFA
jgi:hypothetical protein